MTILLACSILIAVLLIALLLRARSAGKSDGRCLEDTIKELDMMDLPALNNLMNNQERNFLQQRIPDDFPRLHRLRMRAALKYLEEIERPINSLLAHHLSQDQAALGQVGLVKVAIWQARLQTWVSYMFPRAHFNIPSLNKQLDELRLTSLPQSEPKSSSPS